MTKDKLIEAAARRTCCRKEAAEAVEQILKEVRAALDKREDVHLTGIGTLYTKLSAQRQARNPKTGVRVTVPPRLVVRFRPSDKSRKVLNAVA